MLGLPVDKPNAENHKLCKSLIGGQFVMHSQIEQYSQDLFQYVWFEVVYFNRNTIGSDFLFKLLDCETLFLHYHP